MTDLLQPKKFKILFLCTGNSARSILAEYFLRRLDPVHFETFSAGADPRGRVNPYVLELLSDGYHIDASAARSKSWNEYRDIKFDFVITVCDNARESCPVWPGQPNRCPLGLAGSGRRPGHRRRETGSDQEGRRRNLSASRVVHLASDRIT